MPRERYSKPFRLGKDTTAKEMLHCFALAYFAVTPPQKRSVKGLIDALCEDNYSIYEAHMEYPLLPGSTQITESQKKKALELYNDIPSSQIVFERKLKELTKSVQELKRKQKTKTLTRKEGEQLKKESQIIEDKDKIIKKITDDLEKHIKKFSSVSSRTLRNKLYQFTAVIKSKKAKGGEEEWKPNKAAESWINSAYWTAECLHRKNIIGDYSQYVFAHSTSRTVRFIKEQPLSMVASLASSFLGIDRLKSDMFNPADIYAIKKDKLGDIINDYKNVIIQIFLGDEQKISTEPFHKLIVTHIKNKECIPISLKKSLTLNPPAYLIGDKCQDTDFYPLVDAYTHAIEYLSENGGADLKEKIEKLIEINNIKYKHNIETFDVNFTFKYSDLSEVVGKKIVLSDEYYKLVAASMTWNAQPTNAKGKSIGAYTGGAGFTQVAAILKQYPNSREVFEQIKKHRNNAYILALVDYVNLSNITIPPVLNKVTILNESAHRRIIYESIKNTIKNHPIGFSETFAKNVYSLYLVYLNSFLLYGSVNKKEIENIKESLNNFVIGVPDKKIKGLVPTDALRKYGWTGNDKESLKPPKDKSPVTKMNQIKVKEYAKRVYQEDRCAKLEALYFYTGGRGSTNSTGEYEVTNTVLNEFFKKQITMTIYGLITKKGSKIFLTVPELNEKKNTNKNLTQISDALGFKTTPHFLIGNGSND